MALTPDNIIVLYRNGNSDSLSFAQAYQILYKLDDEQIIPINCSGNEILSSYGEFQTEIENQVKPLVTDGVKAILVGYGVPGGFIDGSDTISTTSRLSHINFSYSKKTSNVLYNRIKYQDYSDSDAQNVLVVSRIDAPSLDIALQLINNISTVTKQSVVNGTFFWDKYAILESTGDNTYETDLTDFEINFLPLLNVPVSKTVFWDEYTDVVVPRLISDSFMWAWKADRAGYTFFENDTTARVFLYNADTDGAGTVRDVDDKRFPMLALSSGYVSTAGAMSDPSPDGYLRPRPFFNTLYRGATVGEAFTFSVPYVDWTVSLLGDPLVRVTFPVSPPIIDDLSIDSGWDIMMVSLSKAIAYAYRSTSDLQNILNILAIYNDINVKVNVFIPYTVAFNANNSTWASYFNRVISQLITYIIQNSPIANQTSPFSNYLTTRGIQISALISKLGGLSLNNSLLLPEGQWTAETVLSVNTSDFHTYHFQMDVSLDDEFNAILYSLNTQTDQTNWIYEQQPGIFVQFPPQGVTASYAGLRIRYTSPVSQYFNRGNVFYYRIRQKDDDGDLSIYTIYTSIVYT